MMLKTFTKKHVLSAIAISMLGCGMLTAANATCTPGAYVGGQLGWGDIHQGNFATPTIGTTTHDNFKDTGLAGRVFGGYQFNQNLAAEAGYTKFHNATANATTTVAGIGTVTTNGTIKTDAFDIVGKGILPLQNGFSVYGKLGAAYLRETGHINVTRTVGNASVSASASADAHKVLPTFGAGGTYDITQNLAADVSWMHIQMVGSSSKLANTDFVGAGLTYKFG